MEFDKTKVFTVFNCDEVKVGSKGYFSDYKDFLIKHIQSEDKDFYSTVLNIETNNEYAFRSCSGGYRYFYLVEEPKEKAKRPCTREELVEMLKKQGIQMLKTRDEDIDTVISMSEYYGVTSVVTIADRDYSYEELCEQFTLLDGTPLWMEE